jgi:hypothetical protein
MMTLHYASGAVLMADDVCEALLEYARALAAIQGSDVLVVPVVSGAGETAPAEFLLGPASQLLATPADADEELGRDQGIIDDILQRTELIRPAVAVPRPSASDPRNGAADADATYDHDRS